MSGLGWGLVLLGMYMLLVVLARWLCIARPNIVWTRAQAQATVKRLSLPGGCAASGNGKASLAQPDLRALLEDIKAQDPRNERSGIIGWNGSHQIAQWVLMHEAERLALPTLGHAQLVARLERALGQLGELPQPRREAWEHLIRSMLAAGNGGDTERLERVYRAYLDEVLGEIYEASNGSAIQLAGLYNRAIWIILVALIPLAVLAGFGYGLLLLAGAIGGLISRMQRLVFSTHIPITYGSSWGPLFCAPVLGALAAWTGMVLISLLQTAGVLQVTALQTSLDNLQAPSAALLGTAILLGMSERFLLRLERQAEAVVDPDQTGPASTSAAAQRERPPRPAVLPATAAAARGAGQNEAAPAGSHTG